jgi:hypothetical protein
MMQPIQQLLGFDPRELEGARISGEIPLTAVLINRLIAQQLGSSTLPVRAVVIEPHDGNRVTAHIRLRAMVVPPFTVDLVVEQQPHLPDSPVLLLRWSLVGLGLLARLASPVLTYLHLLPPGIRVRGGLVAIDLAELLGARGGGEVLHYLRRLEVGTRAGRVLVRFEAGVEGPAAPSSEGAAGRDVDG